METPNDNPHPQSAGREAERCTHGVWLADHCYKCAEMAKEIESAPQSAGSLAFDDLRLQCAGMEMEIAHLRGVLKRAQSSFMPDETWIAKKIIDDAVEEYESAGSLEQKEGEKCPFCGMENGEHAPNFCPAFGVGPEPVEVNTPKPTSAMTLQISLRREDNIPAFAAFLRCEGQHDDSHEMLLNVQSVMAPSLLSDGPDGVPYDVPQTRTERKWLIITSLMHEFGHLLEQEFQLPVNEEAIEKACEEWESAYLRQAKAEAESASTGSEAETGDAPS